MINYLFCLDSNYNNQFLTSLFSIDKNSKKDFNVYERQGLNCKLSKCKGIIRKKTISNRSTFFCNICQK